MRGSVDRVCVFGAALLACSALSVPAIAGDGLLYNRDIRPILFENCFACHGPDSASRKAGLRLDQREAAIQAGAIAPGKPDDSEVVRRINSSNPDEVMPPPSTKKKLTQAEKQKLARWIREGAAYQLHWSLIPPTRPALPKVKSTGWIKNPIDAFVLNRLEAEGLQPAPEADRRTLARRVSLDLTGLPPSPEMVEAFVADKSAKAYEELVDRLLQSKQWGEHRGRYWLDYARYADTHGIHFDNYREIWTYREWVIGAFNRNMPYDEFTIENLAGDLLPNRTRDQLIASGFNRCHLTTNEGGAIEDEYLVLYTRDRIETTSRIWLGLTANCAVCHGHKFDPLTQRDFYQMSAFFNNTTQAGMDGNIKDTPPVVVIPNTSDRAEWAQVEATLARSARRWKPGEKARRPEFDRWAATAGIESVLNTVSPADLHFSAPLDKEKGRSTVVRVDGHTREIKLADSAVWQPGPKPDGQALQVQGARRRTAGRRRFRGGPAVQCRSLGQSACGRHPRHDLSADGQRRCLSRVGYLDAAAEDRHAPANAGSNAGITVLSQKRVRADSWVHVTLTYDGSGKAAGVKVYYDGRPQLTAVESDHLAGSIRTQAPFKIGQRSTGDPLSGAGLSDLRIYKRTLRPGEADTLRADREAIGDPREAPASRSALETAELYNWWLGAMDHSYQTLVKSVSLAEREQEAIKSRGEIAYVMQERSQPAMAYVLFRGEYDKRREQVPPATPAVLPAFPPSCRGIGWDLPAGCCCPSIP